MMKISSQVSNLYNELKAIAEDLKEYTNNRLKDTCDSNQWLYICRIKEKESFAQKLEMGRYSSIDLVDDIFACTIVVPNIKDIKTAEELIKEHFNVEQRKPISIKHSSNLPENFSYDSLRLYCKTKPIGDKKNYDNLLFEVQIKTFLEHAWAIATHDFQYKSDEISWSKSRIVSQLKAMLDNIELTINESETLAKSEHIKKEHPEYKDLNKIIKFFKEYWQKERLPKDIRRLALNIKELMLHLDIKIEELKEIITTENTEGRGTNTLSLSIYQVIVQSLINQRPDKMKKFLKSPKKRGKYPGYYYTLLTSGMTIPEDFECSKSLYIQGNEVSTQVLGK